MYTYINIYMHIYTCRRVHSFVLQVQLYSYYIQVNIHSLLLKGLL